MVQFLLQIYSLQFKRTLIVGGFDVCTKQSQEPMQSRGVRGLDGPRENLDFLETPKYYFRHSGGIILTIVDVVSAV